MSVAEIILYSILPRYLLEQILTQVSNGDLEHCFAHVLSREDIPETDEYLIKDISPIVNENRSLDQIFVIETNPERVDESIGSFILKNNNVHGEFEELAHIKTLLT